jgi:transposase
MITLGLDIRDADKICPLCGAEAELAFFYGASLVDRVQGEMLLYTIVYGCMNLKCSNKYMLNRVHHLTQEERRTNGQRKNR